MSETRRDEIIYEEGWREAEPPPEETVPVDEAQLQAKEPEPAAKPLLISIQLVLCLIAALVLFVLKAMDSEAYRSFMTAYRTQMARPVISQEFFDALDVSRLLSESAVTVRSSPDEFSPR